MAQSDTPVCAAWMHEMRPICCVSPKPENVRLRQFVDCMRCLARGPSACQIRRSRRRSSSGRTAPAQSRRSNRPAGRRKLPARCALRRAPRSPPLTVRNRNAAFVRHAGHGKHATTGKGNQAPMQSWNCADRQRWLRSQKQAQCKSSACQRHAESFSVRTRADALPHVQPPWVFTQPDGSNVEFLSTRDAR